MTRGCLPLLGRTTRSPYGTWASRGTSREKRTMRTLTFPLNCCLSTRARSRSRRCTGTRSTRAWWWARLGTASTCSGPSVFRLDFECVILIEKLWLENYDFSLLRAFIGFKVLVNDKKVLNNVLFATLFLTKK